MNKLFVPLVTVIMTHKDIDLYTEVLNALPVMSNLRCIIGDFEPGKYWYWFLMSCFLAAYKAIQKKYTNVKFFGDMVHFQRTTGRRMEELGLKPKKEMPPEDKYRALRRLQYLCIAPVEDMFVIYQNAFQELCQYDFDKNKLALLEEYFLKTWIGFTKVTTFRGQPNVTQRPPLFNYELRNCEMCFRLTGSYVNNEQESW